MNERLFRLLWLSVSAAVATISLKALAWALTGSVGLLSDAANRWSTSLRRSYAIAALRWPPSWRTRMASDGHVNAEYFSAGVERSSSLPRVSIAVTAIDRLLHLQRIEDVGVGLAVS
jgi:divalent metal cation (Fe/Co/Zn/Cd) transporter